MPKYVTPNSLTFSSNAIHCARESGSAMKDGTDEKFFRDAVLDVKSKRLRARGKDRVKATYGMLWSTVASVQSGRRTGRLATRLE